MKRNQIKITILKAAIILDLDFCWIPFHVPWDERQHLSNEKKPWLFRVYRG